MWGEDIGVRGETKAKSGKKWGETGKGVGGGGCGGVGGGGHSIINI